MKDYNGYKEKCKDKLLGAMDEMKKRNGLVSGFLIMCLCLVTGCQKVDTTGDGVAESEYMGESQETYTYVPQIYECSTDSQWINSIVTLDEERVLVFGQEYNNGHISHVSEVNILSGKSNEYRIDIAEERYIGYCVDVANGYVIFSESYGEPEFEYGPATWKGTYITYLDEDFGFLSETDITGFCQDINGEATFYFEYMAVDKDANVYFSQRNNIYVVDKSGKQLARIEINGSVQGMVSVGERILLLYQDKGGNMVVAPVKVQGTGSGEAGLGEALQNIPDCGYSAKLFAGEESYFYIAAQDALFAYDMDKGECREAVRWSDCDLNGLGQLCIAVNQRIISTYCNGSSCYELILLDKVKTGEEKEKITLTIAMLQPDYYMTEQFMKFNRMSTDYRLETKIYATDESPEALEAAIWQLHMDLISGDVGDIVFVTKDMDFKNLASKGTFADLDALLEQDEELDKSDFIENIINVMSVDGKLYGIAPYFNLDTLVGKTANVGTADSWTAEDVWTMMQQHEDAVLLYGMRNIDVLGMFLRYNMGAYYNSQTGECYFNSDSFKTTLKIAARFPKELDLDEVNAGYEDDMSYAEDRRLLTELFQGYGLYALQHYRMIFDEEVSIIGYPVDDGLGTGVSFGNGLYAISASSEKKEAAWQFIRQYLLEDYQERFIDYNELGVVSGFPIRKDVFEQGIENAMKTAPKAKWQHGKTDLELEPLSATDAEYFKRLIYGVTRGNYIDYQMYNIIMEEATAYFYGQKSVDEVAEIIQSRVQVYVNEKH